MARPLRVEFEGAYYHVMNRGRRHENIFTHDKEYRAFLKTLKEACQMFRVHIHAYCLMRNHYHLLVHTPAGNLSRFMRHVNGVYTQKYNLINKTDGALFRGRYKALVIQDGEYLLRVMRYIHRNPLGAGIVKNCQHFRWSSHINYLRQKDEDWLLVAPLLELFDIGRVGRIKRYMEFMEGESDFEIEKFYALKRKEAIVGDGDYVDWVKEKYIHGKCYDSEIDGRRVVRGFKIVRTIINEACAYFRIEENELKKWRRGEEDPAASAAIFLARKLSGLTLKELMEEFGQKSYKTVASRYYRFKARCESNAGFKRILEDLESRCSHAET